MGDRTVVPALLRHLADPATPSAELRGVFAGLGTLGARSAAPAVERFLRLYHAESGDAALATALPAAMNALAALDADRARLVLGEIAGDPLAEADVRRDARASIEALDAPTPSPEPAPVEAPPEPAPDTRPARLDATITAQVFAPVTRQLRECLPEDVTTARVAIVVQSDGRILTVAVTPAPAQECIEALARTRTFPVTRLGRSEQVVLDVRRDARD
jgi:hypothetical protein